MMLNKSMFLTVAVSLLSVSAFASQTQPTTTPSSTDDIRFTCRFEGAGSADKGSGWMSRCRAEGKFERHHDDASVLSSNDQDDRMTVRCNEGDDDEGEKIFDGRIRTRFDDETLFIRGLRHDHDSMDDDEERRQPPSIVIFDVDNRRHDNDEERRLQAQLTYWDDGFVFTIPGECRLERVSPPALN